ncbi:MAG: penicillin-binding protein 1B, partial [Gammaproteobacteria bacterium]|nr:penicillin-binding protein 1B [Gammaproteobacteria bacterium]
PLQRYPLKVEQAFDPAPVYLVDTALQDVVREGTASYLYQMLPPDLNIAGKTGTTEDMRDSWFAGFTGDRLAVAWVGMDDNQPTGLSGASGAMLVWGDIIRNIGARPLQLDRPSNVVDAWIDPTTGLQTDQDCPGSVKLPFIQGSVPQQFAPCAGGAANNPAQRTFDWFRRLFR